MPLWQGRYAFRLAAAALLAYAANRGFARKLIRTGEPSAAEVYGLDPRGHPNNQDQTVELLRFCTAYGTGLDSLVDLTPYSPLIESGRSTGLTFYAFIDTWVNNGSGVDSMFMNNVTGQCTPIVRSQGNGWSLSATLLFWPHTGVAEPAETAMAAEQPRALAPAAVRPKLSLTLASGYYGANFDLGHINVHSGSLIPGSDVVSFAEPVDLMGAADARVYKCQGGPGSLAKAATLGYVAQQTEALALHGMQDKVMELVNLTYETLAYDDLVTLADVVELDNAGSLSANMGAPALQPFLQAKYDVKSCMPVPGLPVYFVPGDVFMTQEMRKGLWWNLSYPFEPVGQVVSADNGTMYLRLYSACPPTNRTQMGSIVPHLVVPSKIDALASTRSLVEEAARLGTARATNANYSKAALSSGISSVKDISPELLFPVEENKTGSLMDTTSSSMPEPTVQLQEPPVLGRVVLQSGEQHQLTASYLQVQTKKRQGPDTPAESVCIVEQWRQGRLFGRDFQLPALVDGDAALLQLAVTGHGWSSTTEQCGEYCHALYQLRINGALARNVSQFRNDCKANPIGLNGKNAGTWFESRNGWCPGSVEPGIFVDVTRWLREGRNTLEVDVLVWNHLRRAYELYTDYSGFAFKDRASLDVGLNLFVYDASAVATARALEHPRTDAEWALVSGLGGVGVVDPTGPPLMDKEEQSLLSLGPAQANPLLSGRQVQASLPDKDEDEAAFLLPRGLRRRLRLRGDGPFQPEESVEVLGDSDINVNRPDVAPSPVGTARMVSSVLEAHRKKMEEAPPGQGGGFPDLAARAPWYLLNETTGATKGSGFVEVPAITGALIQGARRQVFFHVDASALPQDWDHVAVHFQLEKPPDPLIYDRWDRLGSFGLSIDSSQPVRVHAVPGLEPTAQWSVSVP